jgi:hypothetical protein
MENAGDDLINGEVGMKRGEEEKNGVILKTYVYICIDSIFSRNRK